MSFYIRVSPLITPVHCITQTEEPDLSDINTFPCWLANAIEGPHRVTLYLKLNQPSNHDRDFHIQAELYKDKWLEIKEQALPWTVTLSPQRLLLLK